LPFLASPYVRANKVYPGNFCPQTRQISWQKPLHKETQEMAMIKVVSNAAGREITVTEPAVLGLSTLAELAEALGEDLVINQVKNQLKVSFRAVVRRKLEEKDDNEEFVNSDDALTAEDFSDWKPTLRVTKSPEEKAMEALGNLPPEIREAVLANFNNA
jgi:hypothetical protein